MTNIGIKTHQLTLYALLIAMTTAGRIAFQFIPNMQPMTAMLIIISLNLGIKPGFIITLGSLILSNLYLGFGPWTLFQAIAYSLVLGLNQIFRPLYLLQIGKGQSSSAWQVMLYVAFFGMLAFSSGILYGGCISILNVWTYDLPSFWTYYLAGLPFDISHGFGNSLFFLALNPLLTKLFDQRQFRKIAYKDKKNPSL
ncbi:ECF transporter S component [Aerococcus viridans]|uniref:ECF transporter S component n=1 Tax=Aerococcus viridans TaxID=1377 RepID=UPI003B20EE02